MATVRTRGRRPDGAGWQRPADEHPGDGARLSDELCLSLTEAIEAVLPPMPAPRRIRPSTLSLTVDRARHRVAGRHPLAGRQPEFAASRVRQRFSVTQSRAWC
jgi:hypothetical protein